MFMRDLGWTIVIAGILCVGAALSAPLSARAASVAPQGASGPNAPTDVQNIGDWSVRCFPVKSAAPCDMLQVALNKNNKQRVMSVSFAYAPSRDAYATQIVVPLGVALGRGLTIIAGTHKIEGVKFRRCERDGCYVEVVLDKNSVEGLSSDAKMGNINVVPFHQDKAVSLPISLNGYTAALAKLKDLARAKAVSPTAPAPAASPAPAH